MLSRKIASELTEGSMVYHLGEVWYVKRESVNYVTLVIGERRDFVSNNQLLETSENFNLNIGNNIVTVT